MQRTIICPTMPAVLLFVIATVLAGAACGDDSTKPTTKTITGFTILGVTVEPSGSDIVVTLPYGTDVTQLAPMIDITGATITPASGVPQDFTHPVTYTVVAADRSTRTYTVTVAIAPNTAKDITAFTILDVDAAITGTSIALTVPYGTDPTSLTPAVTITGASVSPASGVPQNFTSPVTYTVTAADGSTKAYAVTVNVALSGAKDITAFSILGADADITGTSIALTLPFGTDRASLVPTVQITGAGVSPASGVATDFTNEVTYTVTAANGTTKAYSVTVSIAPSPAKDITAFSILGVAGTIVGTDIALTLPYGTDPTSLAPTLTITGASVSPASGLPEDFSAPLSYTVTAANGTTQVYTVTVTIALNPDKAISSFEILGITGVITGMDIALTVPFGTDLSSLTPLVTITGASVSPPSGATQDFTSARTYTVTAADGTTADYTVTVTAALNPAKDITAFSISGRAGTITGTAISVPVTSTADITSLTPTITITGVSVAPASGVPQDFSSPVLYTVTAADGTTQGYMVSVMVAQCFTDADCSHIVGACDTATNLCRTSITMFSQGTSDWPDEACNPSQSFGSCNTNAQTFADAWASYVCVRNGWTTGTWTGNKHGGCGNSSTADVPSVSVWCGSSIPCHAMFESSCQPGDQTVVEFTCTR